MLPTKFSVIIVRLIAGLYLTTLTLKSKTPYANGDFRENEFIKLISFINSIIFIMVIIYYFPCEDARGLLVEVYRSFRISKNFTPSLLTLKIFTISIIFQNLIHIGGILSNFLKIKYLRPGGILSIVIYV